MSVICKMTARDVRVFPNGRFINLGCVYDQDLAQADHEDVRFTKATPWGEATMTVESSHPGPAKDETIYLFFTELVDEPNFDDCLFAMAVQCRANSDYGSSTQIEIVPRHPVDLGRDHPPVEKRIAKGPPAFNLRMTVDNEAASIQFKPGRDYWMLAYRATDFTMHDAIRRARGGPKEDAAAAEAEA